MGIRVRLCSDRCLREADGESDYPQTAVSCIVRTQYPYFAQRYAGITGFGPVVGSVSILLFVLLCALFFDALSDLEHVLVGGGDDFGALAQVFADFIGCGADVLFVL